jgi:hypothetical protein
LDHLQRRIAANEKVEFQELIFIKSWENRSSTEKFRYDATQTPHIDLMIVIQPQDDLRSSIEARLNVSKCVHPSRARRSKIDDLNIFPPYISEQNIFRLQITMDDLAMLQVDQAFHDLKS